MRLSITKNGINLQLIIFVLIIGILAITFFVASLNGRLEANDKKRLTDIVQIQSAMKTYFDVNGFYPITSNSKPAGFETYLDFWPTSPTANGSCTELQNTYTYSRTSGGLDYKVTFCLGYKSGSYSAGTHELTSKGIQ